ncbi:hypothetical protein ACE01N_18350 [Saccharicrinis sp. FJH2]|uniref:hypothetical protein n=1 Tax=Saccharicrinis sp. FJH65 TaxID=3344659 RepID=UPI0035F4C612
MKYIIIILNLISFTVFSQTDSGKADTCQYEILSEAASKNTVEFVVYENGEPLVGVNIVLLNRESDTLKGTISHVNGEAKLIIDNGMKIKDKTVRISFIGSQPCSIYLSEIIGKKVSVKLKPEKKDKDDGVKIIPVQKGK